MLNLHQTPIESKYDILKNWMETAGQKHLGIQHMLVIWHVIFFKKNTTYSYSAKEGRK